MCVQIQLTLECKFKLTFDVYVLFKKGSHILNPVVEAGKWRNQIGHLGPNCGHSLGELGD